MNNDKVSQVYKGELWPSAAAILKERIHWLCGQVEGPCVLDVGCSQGITSILLAREGFQVTGLDIEAPAIDYAQADRLREQQQVQERLRFIHGDAFDLELDPGTFNTVILGEIIEHLSDPERLLARTFQHLLPGGRLIITTPFGLFPFHDHRTTFNLSTFLQALPVGLEVEHLDVWERYIRFVGRKAGSSPASVPPAELLAMTERGLQRSEERYLKQVEKLQKQVEKLRTDLAKYQARERRGFRRWLPASWRV